MSRQTSARAGAGRPAPAYVARARAAVSGDALTGGITAGGVAAVVLLALAIVQDVTGWSLFSIPFIASAALLAVAPAAPLARPAALVISYPVAVVTSLLVTAAAGPSPYAVTLAIGAAMVVMVVLKATHVPAVAAAAAVALNGYGFDYLLQPLLPALAVVVALPYLIGLLYPRYPYAATWRRARRTRPGM